MRALKRNFFGRVQKHGRQSQRVHTFAKHTKTQTERLRLRRILAAHAASQRRHPTNKETSWGAPKLSRAPNTPRTQQYRSMQQYEQKPGATARGTQPLQQRERAFCVSARPSSCERAAHGAAHAQQQLHLRPVTSCSAAGAASGWNAANCARAMESHR